MRREATRDDSTELAIDHARKDFARLSVHHTVGEALVQLRRSPPGGRIVYFYVLDEENRLQGVVPTRRLLLSPPETPVADIMVRKVITISADTTVLDACEYFVLHRLLAFPIVDLENRVQGVIDVELYTNELADLEAREEGEDIFQLIGVHVEEIRRRGVLSVFGRRFPWLLCNIGGGLACALLAGLYQDMLVRVIVLALFIPVVLALAESVSMQSLTLALQAAYRRRSAWSQISGRLGPERTTGLLLGLATGLLVAIAAWLWHQQAAVATARRVAGPLGRGTPAGIPQPKNHRARLK